MKQEIFVPGSEVYIKGDDLFGEVVAARWTLPKGLLYKVVNTMGVCLELKPEEIEEV